MTDTIFADLSEWQGTIDWPTYGASVPVVAIRDLYGYTHRDNDWFANLNGARRYCLVRIIYQYLVKSQSVAQQAQAMVDTINAAGGLKPGDVFVIDLEEGDPVAAFNAGDTWIQIVHASLGGLEEEYSYLAFLRHPVWWLAAYQNGEPTSPHVLWQLSDRRQFPGVSSPCDANVFHGTPEQLYALVTGGATPPSEETDDMAFSDAQAATITSAATAAAASSTWTFLERLYVDVLGVTPDAQGIAYWFGEIEAGHQSHATVAAFFANVAKQNKAKAPAA